MFQEIIIELKNNSELRELLSASLDNPHIEMFSTSIDNLPAITYTFSDVSDNAIKKIEKLEVRAISTDIATTINIANKVKEIVLTVGDTPLSNNILSVEVNGGGLMEDTSANLYSQTILFNIIGR